MTGKKVYHVPLHYD